MGREAGTTLARGLLTGLLVSMTLAACALDPEAPGALVPPTVEQDPALPQRAITVAGRTRALHLMTFGAAGAPPLLVLHGGPGADARLMLPLRALSDRYFVVIWDQRGAGLSQRIGLDEITLDSYVDEVLAVKAALAPERPATLIGHSFGGSVVTRFAALHAEAVAQLVLIEPGPLTQQARSHRATSFANPVASETQSFFFDNQILSPRDHAAMDYRILGALRGQTGEFYCPDQPPREYLLWRWGALFYGHVVLDHLEDGFEWAQGIDRYSTQILLIASTCGSLNAAFQRDWNVPALPSVRLVTISGAGHLTLFTDYVEPLLAALRGYLLAYR